MLSKLKLVPTFVRSLEDVVHAIRHMQATAVLVDRDQGGTDDLELVLNVRDLDAKMPIILIGPAHKDHADEILSRQAGTFLIHKPINSRSLDADLKKVAMEAGLSNTH
jgi:DNA-binding response OmpR family regulator